jgi:ribosome-binding protein aMBF1 (putative translation factor)
MNRELSIIRLVLSILNHQKIENMKPQEKVARLRELAGDNVSSWKQEALQRQAERDWRPKSAAIALQVLRALRSQKMSQKDLAERVQVTPQYINKIVKGNENLSLETITRLEIGLGISLMTIYVGENRRVGTGPKFPNLPVDYYRGLANAPERVVDTFAQFSVTSNEFSA